MLPLDRQLAETIDGVVRALAEWSTSALYERRHDMEARYGPSGRALWKGEFVNRLQYLAEAIAADRPALFVHSIEWARAAFHARRMDETDLVESLVILDEIAKAELPPQAAARAGRFIAEGLAAARRRNRITEAHFASKLVTDGTSSMPGGSRPDATMATATAEPPAGGSEPTHDAERAQRYLTHLLERQQARAVDVLLEAVGGGMSVAEVYERVISPALVEVGRLWHLQEATVADEHYVTAATQSAIAVLRMKLPRATPNGKRVLAASVGGDLHEVGIRMVADLLESDGFAVDCLGANMPTTDLVGYAIDEFARPQFDLVALSASTGLAVRSVANAIAALRSAAPEAHVPVLVGGGPFVLVPDLWKVVEADGCARTASDAVRLARELCAD